MGRKSNLAPKFLYAPSFQLPEKLQFSFTDRVSTFATISFYFTEKAIRHTWDLMIKLVRTVAVALPVARAHLC